MANDKRFVVKNGLQANNVSFVNESNTAQSIVASMLSTDTLSFSGNSGQLFSITDSMSGVIFAVNDISGIPSIEVDDTGDIRLAEFSGNVSIGTSTDTHKLYVNGMSYLSGNVTIPGNSTSFLIIGSATDGVDANSTVISVGNASVFTTINATSFSGTANNATNLGGSSLATVQGQITGNAATAYTNAITVAANATNLTSGTVAAARLGSGTANSTTVLYGNGVWSTIPTQFSNGTAYTWSAVQTFNANVSMVGNTTSMLIIGTAADGVDANSTVVSVGNATVFTTVNSTAFSGTANNATNLGGSSLATIQGQITGNAATAYTNAVTVAANATNLTTGTVNSARLGSGTANSTTVLYGNGVWATIPTQFSNGTAYTWSAGQTFNANISAASNVTLTTNGSRLGFTANSGSAGNISYFIMQTDNNFVFYNTATDGSARAIWSSFTASNTSSFNVNVPLRVSTALQDSAGSNGSSGQVLTSNGTAVNWTTPAGGSFSNGVSYVWSAQQTYTANIAMVSNTSSIMLAGNTDNNWKLGRNIATYTKAYYTNNSMDFLVGSSSREGISFGNIANTSFLEMGSDGNWFRANVAIGNVAWNSMLTVNGTVTFANSTSNTLNMHANGQLVIREVSANGSGTFDSVSTTNNGNGTNFKVGDDAWIGDVNSADTLSIRGQQNAAQGFIVFGNNDTTSRLGRSGSGPLTYTGIFATTGNATSYIAGGTDAANVVINSTAVIVQANSTQNSVINATGLATTSLNIRDSSGFGSLVTSSFGNSSVAYSNTIFTGSNFGIFSITTAAPSAGGSTPTINITTGSTTGTGTVGNITIAPGNREYQTSGLLTLASGNQSNSTVGSAGSLSILGGNNSGGGGGGAGPIVGGNITIRGGSLTNSSANVTGKTPGSVTIDGGFAANATGANLASINLGTVNALQKIQIGHASSGNLIIYANGSLGTAGQFLTSNATVAYWSSVNASAYTWADVQTFNSNVALAGNATSQLIIGTAADGVDANSTVISVGNSSVFTTINATAFSGTANNADFLDGQHGSYYTNATNLSTGTVNPARLGSGTANSSTVLYGNGVWSAPPTGGGGSSITTTLVTNTSVTAANNTRYILANTSATTVTLPASATLGDVIYIVVANDLTTNIVARNGHNIMSLAEDLQLNVTDISLGLLYTNATLGWRVI